MNSLPYKYVYEVTFKIPVLVINVMENYTFLAIMLQLNH